MQRTMNPMSVDLGNALLKRHRAICISMPKEKEDVREEDVKASILSYTDLLKSIGAPESLAHTIGRYLFEVAAWCEDRGHPPVNALAVNGALRMPGAGYFTAPGGGDWESEVRKCIAWGRYPSKITE